MKIVQALIIKEFQQMKRDPSCIIIAFVLPLMLLYIYMYGVNLDTIRISVGIKNNDVTPETQTLVKSFDGSRYIRAKEYVNANEMYADMASSKLKGIVVIPSDFSVNLERKKVATIQIITDGAEVNLANYAQSYSSAIVQNWLHDSSKYRFKIKPAILNPQMRYWFNQSINSHYFVLPGSLAITMMLIGMLLTALVIAREWERGTMEALLTTNVKKIDIVLGKYFPYFVLGMASMCFSVFMCVFVFKIPFRGNFLMLFCGASLFLLTALGTGLLISTFFKDQFLASQMALSIGLLPSMLMSGLIYPINSMPDIFQFLTKFISARYFVMIIQSEFMAGSISDILIPNCLFLGALGFLLFSLVYENTSLKVD
jgi:ABC-2 type transport system permease protein